MDDAYTQMSGPIEVESVVHHWNAAQGWITNISPQAICDANPGAAILATAALEASYAVAFKAIDFATDALTIATILATFGAGSGVAAGGGSLLRKGLGSLTKDFMQKGARKTLTDGVRRGIVGTRRLGRKIVNEKSLNPMRLLGTVYKHYGGIGETLLKNYLLTATAQQVTHLMFRLQVVSGFVESANDVKQLPIIFSPLLHNGLPFTAGMETDDALHSIFLNDSYYSYRDLQAGAERVLETIFGDNWETTGK
jgi:hypothetical protein